MSLSYPNTQAWADRVAAIEKDIAVIESTRSHGDQEHNPREMRQRLREHRRWMALNASDLFKIELAVRNGRQSEFELGRINGELDNLQLARRAARDHNRIASITELITAKEFELDQAIEARKAWPDKLDAPSEMVPRLEQSDGILKARVGEDLYSNTEAQWLHEHITRQLGVEEFDAVLQDSPEFYRTQLFELICELYDHARRLGVDDTMSSQAAEEIFVQSTDDLFATACAELWKLQFSLQFAASGLKNSTGVSGSGDRNSSISEQHDGAALELVPKSASLATTTFVFKADPRSEFGFRLTVETPKSPRSRQCNRTQIDIEKVNQQGRSSHYPISRELMSIVLENVGTSPIRTAELTLGSLKRRSFEDLFEHAIDTCRESRVSEVRVSGDAIERGLRQVHNALEGQGISSREPVPHVIGSQTYREFVGEIVTSMIETGVSVEGRGHDNSSMGL